MLSLSFHQVSHKGFIWIFLLLSGLTLEAQEQILRVTKTADGNWPQVELRNEPTEEVELRSNSCNCLGDIPGDLLLCENFQEYAEGPITQQSSQWFLWPGATRDGYVDASGSNKFLRLKHSNGAESDVLLDLKNQTSGRYHLSFRLWTWEGYSGYYNIQHNNSFTKSSEANWAYHVQFINGQGNLRIGSFSNPISTKDFDYTPNAWNYITQIIDLDKDEIELIINDVKIGSWQFSLGSKGLEKRLGALDFYAREEFNAQFVVDNICLVRTDDQQEPPQETNLVCLDRGQIQIDGVQLSLKGIKIRNEGPGTSAATNFGYYLSRNYNFTVKDYLIAKDTIPALAPGEVISFDLNMDLRDAPVPDDYYYLGYIIDYPDKVEETNENDNNDCYWTHIRFHYITSNRRPNLVCANRGQLSLDNQLLEIDNMVFHNSGNADAGATELGIYLSANTNITNSDFLVGSLPIAGLEEGNSISLDFKVRLDTLSDVPEGDYYLGVYIDHTNTVKESSGSDNICSWSSSTIAVGPTIDLIANLSCQDLGTIDANFPEIKIEDLKIINAGDTASGPFQLGFYLSDNQTITTNDFLVFSQPVNNIGPGAINNFDININLSQLNLPPGDYFLGLFVDHYFEVEESDNNDNTGCIWLNTPITIQTPAPATCSCSDPIQDFICEDFEGYTEGFFSNKSNCFTTKSGAAGTDEDGVITKVQAFSGNQSLGIRENGLAQARIKLGDKEAGTYSLKWMMFVPLGKTARYTLEGQPLFGVTTKLDLTFGNALQGKGFIVNNSTNFDFPHAEWFEIVHEINMDQNHITVFINNELVLDEWPFYFGLEYIQFLSQNAASNYFIDDLVYDLLYIVQDGKIQTSAWEAAYAAQLAPHELLVFPNPAQDILYVKATNQSGLPAILQLHNELGQLIWQETYHQQSLLEEQLNLAPYKKGLYFLSIQTGTKRQTKKIIRQ